MGADGGAAGHQVLCISHLPQIAAFADAHFRIAKRQVGDRTLSSVEPIADEARIDELAAMLDGVPVTPASRANAREMLERVATWKAAHADGAPAPPPAAAPRPRAKAAARA